MKRVNDYLHGLGDEKAFLQEHPYSVLIELEEGADSQELAEDAEVTHRMQTKEVQRQAVSSREACVYPLLAPLGVLEVGRAVPRAHAALAPTTPCPDASRRCNTARPFRASWSVLE